MRGDVSDVIGDHRRPRSRQYVVRYRAQGLLPQPTATPIFAGLEEREIVLRVADPDADWNQRHRQDEENAGEHGEIEKQLEHRVDPAKGSLKQRQRVRA